MAPGEGDPMGQDYRTMIDSLKRTVESMDFTSEEELSEYLNTMMVGKTTQEVSAELSMLGSEKPELPLQAANRILSALPQNTSVEVLRDKAIEVLAISPQCVAAHVVLGNAEDDAEKAVVHYEAAIAVGREIHADLIAAVANSNFNLWASHDARDFLVALERLADAVDGPDAIERRFEIFQEIIQLNPTDNLGIRANLLAEYIADMRLDDARKLLAQFPDDTLPAIAFGRALLALIETAVETDFQVPQLDFSDHDQFLVLRKRLPGNFRHALSLLEAAFKTNPSIALLSLEHEIMEVEVPEQIAIGGPYEAVEYIQRWGEIWLGSGLPMLLLQSYVSPKLVKLIKAKQLMRAELREVEEQLDDAEGGSWIEKFFASSDSEAD